MKKLFQMRNDFQLYHGDCLEVLKGLPDNSIDMVLADPPYGIMTKSTDWDNIIDLARLWEQLNRIKKDKSAVVMFSQQPFSSKLVMSNLSNYRCEWIWDKHIARGMQTARYKPMCKHENILVFGNPSLNYYPIMVDRDKPVKRRAYPKGKTYFNGENDKEYRLYTQKHPDTIITGCWENNTGKLHPTQKPVTLLEYLIKTYSKEEETILDFCYGSNSTGIAAYNTNRKYIGIEKDEIFFEMGKQRLLKHLPIVS